MGRRGMLLAVVVVGLAAGACSSSTTSDRATGTTASGGPAATSRPTGTTGPAGTRSTALPAGYQGFTSDQYANGRHWICHPQSATEDVCSRDLTTTIVEADGRTRVEPHAKATDPPIDCFYVYPTISNDQGFNSDLEPAEDNEIWATLNQVARLNSTCRVYAPVYRQLTISSLLSRQAGSADPEANNRARETAYADVLAAWKHYVANENDGRGVILVGHSQGAGVLRRLVAEEIDDQPLLRDRLVGAYLLGTTVAVPPEKDVGGDFDNVPLCRSADQTGCVITYASFPASSPPPDNSLFGAAGLVQPAIWPFPAALAGGQAAITPYFAQKTVAEGGGGALAAAAQDITTPWVSPRGILTAECVTRNSRSVLEITVAGNPADTRDQTLRGGLPANWGTHLADANLAMGELETLAKRQAEAFANP
jgi:hypothetical protein